MCCWYLGARPSRGARARAHARACARGPPRPVGVRQHEQNRKHFPHIYGSVQNIRRTPTTNHGRFSIYYKGYYYSTSTVQVQLIYCTVEVIQMNTGSRIGAVLVVEYGYLGYDLVSMKGMT